MNLNQGNEDRMEFRSVNRTCVFRILWTRARADDSNLDYLLSESAKTWKARAVLLNASQCESWEKVPSPCVLSISLYRNMRRSDRG